MNVNGVWLTVISTGRPHKVPRMTEQIGPATWYVKLDEGKAYIDSGAHSVWEINGGLCMARNAALEDAFEYGLPCVQVSDDLLGTFMAYYENGLARKRPIPFWEAVGHISAWAGAYSARLAGIAPTDNPYFYDPRSEVSQDTFIVGDLIYVKPSSPRFDEEMILKEDYDFTLQHIRTYGTVARCNAVLGTFSHRSNSGGAVDYRTPERELDAIRYLKRKWGSWIKLNSKRPNEVLLRLPRSGSVR